MTRTFLLKLSQSKALREFMETSPLARKLNRRFIAGMTLEEEVAACAELAKDDLWSAMDHLGENVTSLGDGVATRDAYMQALDAIADRNLPSTISLKLTALGLDLSEEAAVEHLRTLAARAKEIGSRVEIDMEDTRYTETTVRIAETVGRETGCILVAIQAYLYRTPADIDRLNRAGLMVRLTKGAYIEPSNLAIQKKSDVDTAYLVLGKKLLDEGIYPALGTHDEKMIEGLLSHVREKNIPPDRFELEMLHGVRRDLHHDLVKRGFRVRIYVPYGAQWYRYFMRRLAERPANMWFLAKNLFR
jgi:proline dehydrogenase